MAKTTDLKTEAERRTRLVNEINVALAELEAAQGRDRAAVFGFEEAVAIDERLRATIDVWRERVLDRKLSAVDRAKEVEMINEDLQKLDDHSKVYNRAKSEKGTAAVVLAKAQARINQLEAEFQRTTPPMGRAPADADNDE